MAVIHVLTFVAILIPNCVTSAVLSTSLSKFASSDESLLNRTLDTQVPGPGTWLSHTGKGALAERKAVGNDKAGEFVGRSRRQERATSDCPGLRMEKEIYVTQTLTLPCSCQPKGQKLLGWTVHPRGGEGEMSVWFDEEERFELKDKFEMTIRHAQVTDSGRYFCRDDSKLLVTYNLIVKEPKAVRLSLVALREKTLPNRTAGGMTLFTLWSPWGQCNRCGGSGERARIGICHVESRNFPKQLGTVIACDSGNLPTVARREFGEEINRPDERRVEFCTEPCPTEPTLTVVTDSGGRVLSSVRRLGLRHRPTLPPPVSRKTMFRMKGENIKLLCPGEGMDRPVSWKNGSAVLTETELRKTTEGRIFVDIVNSLHIRELKKQDGNTYSCWIKNRHVATIKVFVREPVAQKGWQKYSTYGGVAFAAFIGLFITIMTVKNSRNKSFR